MIEIASTVLLFLAFTAFAAKRGLTYLHAYQQEEYDSPRFLRWMWKHKVFDKRLSLLVLGVTGISFFTPAVFLNFLIFLGLAVTAYLEKDPRKNSKKKLVMTARAKRIFLPAYGAAVFLSLWCFLPLEPMPWLWILNIQLVPFLIAAVNAVLSPLERSTQKKFWDEAHQKVLDYKPTVIGITGSFGKTSVKHILGHILKTQAPTLMTPGSVNTPMGIARIVREQLEPHHKYLLVEMGAYGPGSIGRLCRLTPPDYGVISAIGHAHYERFKTLEAVAETKYELAQAVISKGGKVVVHERTLRFEYTNKMRKDNPNQFTVCGETPPITAVGEPSYLRKDDLEIHKVIQSDIGLEVRFSWKGTLYNVEAPLYGLHHGHNIALAFAMAVELGISSKDIQTALMSVPQIEHRLEVKKQPGNFTLIDDAFNSNPMGFQAALGLLSTLGDATKGRKILITPGMVELGKIHDEAHKTIGKTAGELCDIVIVVQGKRIPTFIEGFKETGGHKPLHSVESFAQAQDWLLHNKQKGDVVLIENDLPDIYERVPKI